jgi:hypothetical protein
MTDEQTTRQPACSSRARRGRIMFGVVLTFSCPPLTADGGDGGFLLSDEAVPVKGQQPAPHGVPHHQGDRANLRRGTTPPSHRTSNFDNNTDVLTFFL